MTQPNIYYRPVWTCGRYNEKAQAAIFYNLIAGMSYFFESYSAMVIGEILSVPRNGKLELDAIAAKLNIAIESLVPFFEQLEQMGIVSSVLPTEEIIVDYRKRVCEYNCQSSSKQLSVLLKKNFPMPFPMQNSSIRKR